MNTPIYNLLNQNDHTLTNQITHLTYHNINKNHITILNKKYYKNILKNKILNNNLTLIKQTHKKNHKIIIINKKLEHIMKPIIQKLNNINHLIYNHLKFKNKLTTNKLLNPIINNHNNKH